MDKKTVRRVVIIAAGSASGGADFFPDLWVWTACTVWGYVYGRTEK